MRRLNALHSALLFVLAGALSAETIIVKNGTVVDGTGAPPRVATVVVANGRIAAVGTAPRRLKGARVIDARGKYVIPGLWDMHVHLWDADPHLGDYLKYGVTGVRDMGSDFARTERWRRDIESGKRSGPRIYTPGAAVSGTPSKQPKLPVIVTETTAQAFAAVDRIDDSGADFVKVLSSVPHDAYVALAQRARLRRVPFVGHVPQSITVWEAIDARQKSMEHLFGVSVPDGDRKRLLEQLRMFAVWQTPTLVLWKREPDLQPSYQSAATLVRDMARSGVGLLAGTDTGDPGVKPGAALHDELELLVAAGLTPLEALQTATLNPARFFDEEATIGTIRRGRVADLVILDANPLTDIRNTRKISHVISRGRVVNLGTSR